MKKNFVDSLSMILISVLLCLLPITTASAAAGDWSVGENMHYARWAQTMVALPDGKAMVVSGCSNGYCSSFRPNYEIYDPQMETWTAHDLSIDGTLYGFGGLDAITLADQKVLIAGVDSAGTCLLYDPQTGLWTKAGSLHTARFHGGYYPENAFFAIARSGDYGALVTGGKSGNTVLRSAESFDSRTNTWSEVSDMAQARWQHSAATLANGKILVAGGWDQNNQPLLTAELYDPTLDQWTETGAPHYAHVHDTAILLDDGQVLLTGIDGAELYDPEQGAWTDAGFSTWLKPGILQLPDGRVLFAGGAADNGAKVSSAAVYDPVEKSISSISPMNHARYWSSAALLSEDNTVLVAGGFDSTQGISSVELYDTGIPVSHQTFIPLVVR